MALFGDSYGSWQIADWKHSFFLAVTAGLNNQQLGLKVLLFQRRGVVSGNIRKMRGYLVDCLDKIFD
jgi:hypothetical protein